LFVVDVSIHVIHSLGVEEIGKGTGLGFYELLITNCMTEYNVLMEFKT